ncbi:winged helix-turn-helix domain-containing protein [Micromonospora sp. WMMD998]|uniref:winged helix-turn-helix domain-containing protein n=1 Tax=Micromonospora sp. WMMD998 TaxID=3016092 RepID=UPI00249A64AD|nr:winged helix-turn-helix domain-containing protein [Micromonospora sp. WMMD998]WFE39742.1 winged helix-turn-helix domain-containing protein [Micromonospora sp. WMMD998]
MPPQYRYQQIAEDMVNRIKSGEFPPGSRLPSRAELCEQYEVSSFVADRVYLMLKMHGLTESLPGAGVYVKESAPGQ